jgi:hypothetical protein
MPTILEQPKEATESGGASFILLFICTGCKISVVISCGFIYLFYQIGNFFPSSKFNTSFVVHVQAK